MDANLLLSDPPGLQEDAALALSPRRPDKKSRADQASCRHKYAIYITFGVASFVLDVMAMVQAFRLLPGKAMALCLMARGIGMMQDLVQATEACRSTTPYSRRQHLINTLQRLRGAAVITVILWCSRRRELIEEIFTARDTMYQVQNYVGLLQMPVLNILSMILHPVNFKTELVLQALRVTSYALLEAPVFLHAASSSEIAWASICVCKAANTAAQLPWQWLGSSDLFDLLSCDPGIAVRFTVILVFIIFGVYAPGMIVYHLERTRKLRWIAAGLAHRPADLAEEPLQPLSMPLWAMIPVHIYLITCSTVALGSLLQSITLLTGPGA